MKVVTVVGARPQFIKGAPVHRVLRRRAEEILVHTGQHYDPRLSEVFFDELNIPRPDYHLGVGSKSHGAQTGEMLTRVEEVLKQERPDLLLVYGDTNSTLAGALAAVKMHIPIAHVEAGLRSFNRRMPEEINRVLTDHLSRWLFCPTQTAVQNLNREGILEGVHLTGDVMLDAVRYNQKLAQARSRILKHLELEPHKYLLITLHRAENTDVPQRLKSIVAALNELAVSAVFPMHPRTRNRLRQMDLSIRNPLVKVIEPVGYLDMLQLEESAMKIVTDSGGVQKEAFFLQVPVITLREETEWVETVAQGANRLVGANKAAILEAVERFEVDYTRVSSVFGDGRAAERIADHLMRDLEL